MSAPARYFPVSTEPLRMKAGLLPLGTDFGNGAADRLVFQLDEEASAYRAAKAKVPDSRHVFSTAAEDGPRLEAALAWLEATLDREHPGARQAASGPEVTARAEALSRSVQEDFAVVHRGDGQGRALLVNVCFPSGWRPEVLANASFASIHAPVPGFASPRLSQSMVEAMIDRGPFVRFVWTVCADAHLDHHPTEGAREKWTATTPRGWLRVERQLTLPLPAVDCALFLIRTSLTPFEALSVTERATLAEALRAMPDEVARYKSLYDGRPRMLELLGRA